MPHAGAGDHAGTRGGNDPGNHVSSDHDPGNHEPSDHDPGNHESSDYDSGNHEPSIGMSFVSAHDSIGSYLHNVQELVSHRRIMQELVAGLSYLHKSGVAHRDMKPDTISMDTAGTPYSADFGVSSTLIKDKPTVSTVEGTALCMPPERFSAEQLKVNAFAADVWSLGVTLYMVLFGLPPFSGSNFQEISHEVCNKGSCASRPSAPLSPHHGGICSLACHRSSRFSPSALLQSRGFVPLSPLSPFTWQCHTP